LLSLILFIFFAVSVPSIPKLQKVGHFCCINVLLQ